VLAEITHTARSGSHLFLFCFGGRLVHQGLAALLAWRLSRQAPRTFAISVNDYALELHSASRCDFAAALQDPALFSTDELDAHALAAVNAAELGRRRFRRIARVAGLVFEGWPGARKSARQIQTSAALLYDVLARHEPDNLLLTQARQEVLDTHFDAVRLTALMERLNRAGFEVLESTRPSPMAFPLVLDRVEARMSSESARQRVERLRAQWVEAMQPVFAAAADGAAPEQT
jgi:ATP-dependent Lhr-like helicase